jgi:exodeoxyribonuclease V beta subunit
MEDTGANFERLSDEEIVRDLQKLALGETGISVAMVPGSTQKVYVPPTHRPAALSCRTLSREIPRGSSTASVSSLVAAHAREVELPDHDSLWRRGDEEPHPLSPSSRGRSFLDFPRGRRAGTALHELLEVVDFSLEPIEAARQVVREKLAQFGFEIAWQEAVLQMLQATLSVPLDPTEPSFHLLSLPPAQRLHELEFCFPLDLLTSKRLGAAFAVHRSLVFPTDLTETLERLDFVPVHGNMRGFIDLVFEREGRFYLVDWKSNFLGPNLEAYGAAALRDVMKRELYVLQYHLYAVALDRYLAFRIPGYRYKTHFGGVFYLFLRGINPEQGPEYGVFRDRPSEALIRELSRCLHAAS